MFYNNNTPNYEYYVSEIHGNYTKWENNMFKKHELNMFMKTIYWKLDEFSCILVLRNKKWFEIAIVKIQETWKIIQDEKITGYQHRAPKKRIRKNSFDINETKCFIQLSQKVVDDLNNNESFSNIDNISETSANNSDVNNDDP